MRIQLSDHFTYGKLIKFTLPTMAMMIISSIYGVTSAIISFLRTLVFQVAAVMLLPIIFNMVGTWYSIIVAEFMAMALSAIFVVLKRKKYHYT